MARITTKTLEAHKSLKHLNLGDGLWLVPRRLAGGGLSKTFDFRFTFCRKARRMSLGPFPEVTLAKAREMCAECAKQVANGINPLEHRKAEAERTMRSSNRCGPPSRQRPRQSSASSATWPISPR